MASNSRRSIIFVLFGVLVLVGATLYLWPKPQNGGLPYPDYGQEKSAAYELQKNEKWCDAKASWEGILAKFSADSTRADYRAEVDRNLQMLKLLCEPRQPPVESVRLSPAKTPPEAVSTERVAKFYPVGRTVRSVAYVDITGKGTNRDWIFQGTANFAYRYRMAVETEVKQNNGMAVIFEQRFPDVTQMRAVCDKAIELHLPENPLLEIAWYRTDTALSLVPQYQAFKTALELVNKIDPKLKRTLTYLHEVLRRSGVPVPADDSHPIDIAVQIEKLAGLRVEIEYVSGMGPTYCKVLDGKKFDPDDLTRLAQNSALFMDYFVDQAAKTDVGQTLDLRCEDVGGLTNFGYDVEATGKLTLKKDSDSASDEKETVMSVTGGEVVVTAPQNGVNRTATITPLGGDIHYSLEKLFVRQARAEWKANTNWVTTNHLLFGTEKIRDIKVESRYFAEMLPADKSKASP